MTEARSGNSREKGRDTFAGDVAERVAALSSRTRPQPVLLSGVPGWLAVDQAAVALTETAPLLLTPGRRCQNGRAVPVERADWKKYVADLVDVSKLARRASQKRDFEAFIDISEKLNDACANCHKVYRDKGGAEGSGATRCQFSEEK